MKTDYTQVKSIFHINISHKLLIILLSFISSLQLFSQEKTFLTYAVTIENEEEEGIGGVTAKLFEKGSLSNTLTTMKDGVALFKLNPNTEYTIEFSKPGYVSKIVSVNTKIPQYENQVFEVAAAIFLFQPCKGLDLSILSNPVAKLAYNDVKRDFIYDKNYENVMRDKLEQLMQKNADCIEEEYKAIVRKADKLFNEKKYLDSKSTYQEALAKRPKDEYVIGRIKEIDDILAQQKDADKAYKDYIAQADKQFNAKNYPLAKEFYKRAASLKPNEAYPPAQIAAIDALLAEKDKKEKDEQAAQVQQAQQEQARQAQLAKEAEDKKKADQALKAQQAKEAADREAQLEKEEEAKQAKLEQEERDRKAAQAKAEQDRKEQDRQAKLAQEEQARKDKEAQKAKLEQEKKDKEAQRIKDEQAQKERDAKLAKEEQERKASEARYQALVAAGDDSFESDVCGKTLQSYRDALAEKPNDPVILKKIALAESKCKEDQEAKARYKSLRDVYDSHIANGDKLFAAKNYIEARSSFEKALQMFPKEEYPLKKINEIVDILKIQEKEEQQLYKRLLSDANKAFDNENFPVAKDLFTQILKLRPNDQYSKEKLQTIESIEAEQKRLEAERKAKLEQYNKLVADADASFKKPDYSTAKSTYQKALALLPSESYPKQKLGEIDAIEKAQQQKIESDYTAKVQSGDRNFATKNYTQALKDYQDAQKIKPDETYPGQRINDVNKLLAEQDRLAAEQKAKQDAYNAAVQKADNLFKNSQYDQAIIAYKEASSYKPDEPYPFSKIDEINKLKKQKEAEEAYKKAIATANSFFDQKKYEQAKTYYAQALLAKPDDQYANSQISKADAAISEQIKKLADAKARQDAFDKAMADADKNFSIKDYEMAKSSYQTALSIFPDKALAKQRIEEIDNILKAQKRNEEYKSVFDEANALFSASNYEQAKAKYKAAQLIKPEEMAPGDKIKEIDRILAQKAAEKEKQDLAEKNYNETIRKANDLFDKAQYDLAKKEYEAALVIMPNEVYPKQKIAKIAEINKLLAASEKQTTTKETKPKTSGKSIADLSFKNDSEREIYLRDLLTKYPPGITCEVYKEASRVVTRYIIIRENQANEIREVKYNWGGIDYTRNGKPITFLYFSNQVKSREGEYFNKSDM